MVEAEASQRHPFPKPLKLKKGDLLFIQQTKTFINR